MLDEQTLTSAAWLPLQVRFQKDSMKVVMLLTMKTMCDIHTVCNNLTYSYAMRIECVLSFHVGCLHRCFGVTPPSQLSHTHRTDV